MQMKQEGEKKGSLRAEQAVQEPGIAAECPHTASTGLGGDSALMLGDQVALLLASSKQS